MKKNLFLTRLLMLCSSILLSIGAQAQLTVYNVTGGGSFCSNDTGVHVGLDGSDVGIPYQLYKGVTAIGSPLTGSGTSLDFGLQTTGGVFTVVADPGAGDATTMSGSATVSTNTIPASHNVTGGGAYCSGGTGVSVGLDGSDAGISYQLYNGTPVGSALYGGAVLDFGLQTGAGAYMVVATDTATGCNDTMSGSAVITVNSLPAAYNVTGGGNYCSGGTGVSVGLDGSDTGVSYQLYDGGPVGSAVSGSGSSLDFGLQTAGGTYNVVATNNTTSCVSDMTGTTTVTANSLPAAYNVTGGGNYCSGGTGVSVGLDGSDAGISYQLYNGGAIGSAVSGSGSALSFGSETGAGSYTVVATDNTTFCTNNMSGTATVTVNALPATYNVTGGGAYCNGGTGVTVGLDGSDAGISYQLYNGGAVGSAVSGSGSALSFGSETGAGGYTVVATDNTTFCTNNMSGTATVTVNALPATYNVTGGGAYCNGGTGVTVGLDGSDAGISYQLYNGGAIGSAVSGSGSALSFGSETGAGSYTVVATDNTTFCTNNMTGTTTVTANSLPAAYNVTGGGNYCSGGTGVSVGLDGSDTGVSYQLYDGGPVGSAVSGSGSSLDFGLQTAGGTYSIVATNNTTSCVSDMTGTTTVTANTLPAAYNVTGGGNYCSGGTGVSVGLDGSDTGVSYQLYDGGPVGSAVSGSGSALDFGLQTAGGTYSIVATNNTTSCVSDMTGTTTVTANSLPAAYNVTGGGNYCSGGTGVSVGLDGSDTGVSYQLYDGGPVGSAVSGSGSALDFGLQTAGGTYSIVATNNTTRCVSDMTGTTTVTANTLPAAYNVTGGGNYCSGGTGVSVGLDGSDTGVSYQLYDGGPVGSAVSGSGSALDFGLQTSGGTYNVVATNNTTSCVSDMTGTTTVTANSLPAAYNVTGGGNYCSGGTGVSVGLDGSDTGVSYQLYDGGPVGSAVSGSGSALDFGLQTAGGTYSIVATNNTTSCVSDMTGTTTVTANSLPAAYNVTGGGNYCSGGTGVSVGLDGSDTGVSYQLYDGGPVGSAVSGSGSSLDFGLQTAGGTYSIVATNNTTSCVSDMTGTTTVTANSLPAAYNITGGGNYCSGGTGVSVGLDGSDTGVSYQLYDGGPVGSAVSGSGSSLDFGLQTSGGTYSIVATNNTTSCVSDMTGTTTVTANSLPAAYNVTGGGNYCSGGTGVSVGLDGSDTGVSYQLYDGGPVGSAVSGSGSALDFGLQTSGGTYNVVATNNTTSCVSDMTGTTTVTANSLPAAYNVTGGGNYCSGGTGVSVGLDGSDTGVSYQLYDGGPVGSAVSGSGSALDFGLQTSGGTYNVVATNNTTSCVSDMTGTTTVTANSLPAAYNVTGGGNYCSGGTGVSVGLDGSDTGVSYQLYDGGPVGSAVSGSGSSLDFGLQTSGGTYSIVATNNTTSCVSDMTGTTTVTANSLPAAYNVTGGGNYCSGGTGVSVGLDGSDTGVSYQLYDGGPVGSAVSGSGSSLDFGLQTSGGTYNVVATNNTTSCVSDMTGTTTVTANSLPAAYNVTGGGNYCSGGTGVSVGLDGSDTGVSYQLYDVGPVGSAVSGSGSSLDFGLQTSGGTYNVVATNNTTRCVSDMTGTTTVTANTLPAAYNVTGGGNYCSGATGVSVGLDGSDTGVSYQLYDGGPVGSAVSGSGSSLDFGLQTAGGTYNVVATNNTTSCVSDMTGTTTVTANTLPAAYNVTGGGNYCSGGTGVTVGLDGSDAGISYQLYNGGTVGSAVSGSGSALSFGSETGAGSYTVIATDNTTFCTNNMSGTATVTVNALPATYNVTGGGAYCNGGTGVTIGLNGSDAGISYQLYNGGAIGSAVSGSGSALSFGSETGAGSYTVVATDNTTFCTNNMSGTATVTVNALPATYNVTGGGAYCNGGTGVTVGLDGSDAGISYQLYNGGTVGSAVSGSGSALSFGSETGAGSYTVIATDNTTFCTNNMSGTATVTVNALPATYNVTGGGAYCNGGTGVTVGLDGSDAGISYQLYNGGAIGSAVSGSGSALSFGSETGAGSYTVVATDNTTFCTNNMSGTATVTVNALPATYNVTGGGAYCNGGTGVTVGLDGSDAGISYQLYNGGAIGSAVSGSGSALSFGSETGAGSYTVVATDNTTFCTNNMSGTATVTVNALPATYNVTGGGAYCNGGTGVTVGLDGSDAGISYQLYNGGTVGSAVSGSGSALSFGSETGAGSYTVVATDNTTFCTNNMSGTATVTVNALPATYNVTGGGAYCNGGTGVTVGLDGSDAGISYQLYNGGAIGSAVSGSGSALSFGSETGAGSYTVVATDNTTFCTNNMSGTATVTVNALPATYNVTGGGAYCNGGTGVTIGLDGSDAGISYQLYNGGTVGSAVSGSGSALSFGSETGAGSYTVVATDNTTFCTNNMSGTATVTVNALPATYNVTGGGAYCNGGTGVTIGLDGSDAGISYQLYNGGAIGSAVSGSGSALSFGSETGAGSYTVIATDNTTFCTNNMSGTATVTVNALPATYNVTGGGAYCNGGTGVTVGLDGSDAGISYQLYNGGAIGSAVSGSGSALSFGSETGAGSYTVVATDNTTFCTNNMSGTATVTVNALPATYNVTGGGAYCNGGTGVTVGLDGSDAGISYQLYNGGAIGSAVSGSGSALSFGSETGAGSYTVVATDNTTFCTNNMSGTATVTVNALPATYNVTGGGAYCNGGTGVTVGLDGSDAGISYQLYNGGAIGSAVSGSGSALSFGSETGAGAYTVIATNTTTSCNNTMTGSVVVTVNALPVAYTVAGGGIFCANDSGAHVYLSSSASGINYQLYNGVAAAGSAVSGTGTGLDFGLQTTGGTYTVVATDGTTSCTNNMSGSAAVTSNPIPASHTVTGGGGYCNGGTGVTIGLNGSDTGISYQLYNGGTAGSAVSGSGSALNFGLQTTGGTYTVVAANTTTSCNNTMTGSAVVTINALPVVYAVSGGGTFCANDTGVHVFLSSSASGINYQLYNGITAAGSAVSGTGSGLDLGLQTTAGAYTVVAADATTGCTSNMSGSATVTTNPVPASHNVTGGGTYCPGGTGVSVGLDASDAGISYQLYNGTPVGSALDGGETLDFGLQTATGTYTVVAANTTTGCNNTMAGNAVIATYTLPEAFTVSGGGTFCAGDTGAHVFLSSSATGIYYQLYNGISPASELISGTGFMIDFGAQTTSGTYTAKATDETTSCINNMDDDAIVSNNPYPVAFSVNGGGYYCVGGSGVSVGLSGSEAGVNYQLYNGSPVGSALTGSGAGLDFGLQSAAGTYTVVAVNATAGCTDTMSGNTSVAVNPVPTVYSMTEGGSYCSGGSGVSVGISGSDAGVTYQLYNSSAPAGSPVAGTGFPMEFGLQTAAGSYSVIADPAVASCTNAMTGTSSVTVLPLPSAYTVTGGGSYCSGGGGADVSLSNSAIGINYQLLANNIPAGVNVAGTSAALDFGAQTASGAYTIIATNSTTSCTNNMTGSVTVSVNASPASFSVTGGGGYCAGGAGKDVGLSGSVAGTNYQLMLGASIAGAAVPGTGNTLDFGMQTSGGTYTVVATNTATGCTGTMSGNAVVSVNPLPTVHNVTGGGAYCSGGTGVSIGLNGSDAGVNYQLYQASAISGALVTGAGAAISFGNRTTAGSYTVVATNPSTGCVSNMFGSASVSINSLPGAFAVSGGGGYCAGGTGVHIGLLSSEGGTTYQLFNASALTGAATGTGAAVDFGAFTAAGTYTVVATNTVGCTATMPGSAIVAVNSLPAAYTVTVASPAHYCAGGSGVSVGLSGSNTGISYQLYNGGLPATSVSGTGSPITFGLNLAGSYTVVATNTTTSCSSNMTGSASVTTTPLPATYAVTGGGGYCSGGTGVAIGLGSSNAGINYTLTKGGLPVSTLPGVGGALNFGMQATAGIYTVVAVDGITLCSSTMSGSAVVTINQPPVATYTVAGGGSYCPGGAGADISISNSDNGVNYQLINGGAAVGSALAGFTGIALDFGPQTGTGTYSVLAANATTGCTSTLANTVTVSLRSLPAVFAITGGGAYCSGTPGAHVGLISSGSGISYQVMDGIALMGAPLTGTGSSLDFGAFATGTYTIIATDPVTTCSANMSGSAVVTADAALANYTITGGGNYCAGGSGVPVGLVSSGAGIDYQLMYAGAALGVPLTGTGATLNFGSQTAGGSYTVVATNAATGCTATMPGSATVTINSLPAAHTITGGGNYCPGGAGVTVSLDGSDAGINYQLMNGGSLAGPAISGTGGSISFGLLTAAGSYTVVAANGGTACTADMSGSVSVGTYPLPSVNNVTGGGNYCPGGAGVDVGLSSSNSGVNYQLLNGGLSVGSALPGTGFSLDFGLQAAAGTYTVVATNAISTCTNNMSGSATVGINTLPTAFNVTGTGNYCFAGAGRHVGLDGSVSGTTYQLYNGIALAGVPVAGTGSALDFGAQTVAGNYTVIATNASTACTSAMSGSAVIGVDPLPAVHILSAGGNYCAEGAGIDVNLNASNSGVNYQLYNGAAAAGLPVPGTGSLIDFGNQAAGTYAVIATDMVTGCNNTMSGTSVIVANPLPAAFTVTGGGNYCNGSAGVHVALAGSNTGISYQLLTGGTPSGSAVTGTGAALDFGLKTAVGSYTVIATNGATGCTNAMTGGVSVGISALPAQYTVTASGSNYCAGGDGIDINLSGTTAGVNYQLYDGGSVVAALVAGTGSALDFGMQTGAGTYTVVAIDAATGCNNNMIGGATIVINPLPAAYATTGGGNYCSGAAGVHVGLTSSNGGVSYQLFNGSTALGSAVTGSGLSLDFGLQTLAGAYTIVATNTATGCSNGMTGSVNVSITSLPAVYTVTGGGNYCESSTGVHVGLTGSTAGVNYQLSKAGALVGLPVAGTGIPLDFGLQTGTGNYTVTAMNTAGCSSLMAGSATVGVNALPAAYAMIGGGNYCPGGAGVHVGIAGSATGVNYQLNNGSASVGTIAGTGTSIDFGLRTAPGTYGIVATNAVTGCTANMSGVATVGIDPLPAVFSVTGGGNYCAGGDGVHVGINGSATGVSYQLYNGAAMGIPVTGAGGPLDFGLQTAAGTYTVIATSVSTTCTNNMAGSAPVVVNPLAVASVSLSTGVGDSVCAGQLVTLSSLAVNGGSTPAFSWAVNGIPVSATGSAYTYMPADGDVVGVTMASSAACATPSEVSNSQTLTVLASGSPTVSVAATPGEAVCRGTSVTYNNYSTFGGSPAFTWFVNGTNVGSSPSFTYVPANHDEVFAIMASNYRCRLENTATSNYITMEVADSLLPVVAISADPGTSIAWGQSLTLTASVANGGSTPVYQWYVNGIALPGANGASLTGSNYNNGDSISCQVISSGSCAGLSGFNSVVISVGTTGVAQVTSAGSDIKLIPNPNNGIFTVKGSLGTTGDEEVSVEVSDMLGQVIFKDKVMAHGGNISEKVQLTGTVPNGMYILSLHSATTHDVFHVVVVQ